MITSLMLKNFKSFENMEIGFHEINTIIGTNASGKSNIRDALRILHAISRGYTLSEIFGGKYGEGGVPLWSGIRGGTREVLYKGAKEDSILLGIKFNTVIKSKNENENPQPITGEYGIEIEFDPKRNHAPRIKREQLYIDQFSYNYHFLFLSQFDDPSQKIQGNIWVECGSRTRGRHKKLLFRDDTPILIQFINHDEVDEHAKAFTKGLLAFLRHMRFMDVDPEAMRQPSLPGQTQLSDKGENLSSVLHSICSDQRQKDILLEWLRELTPQDIEDLEFSEDFQGKVIFYLKESDVRKISAYSASDGTLRYLAYLAALLGKEETMFYFFEEIENGIHPSRLKLLISLLEQRSVGGQLQMVLSTHSPNLLGILTSDARRHVTLIYRSPEASCSKAISITSIPGFDQALQNQQLSDIHASSWFENVMELIPDTEEPQ